MPHQQHFDLAVLGGGSAGYAAARTSVELGLKTVVFDGSETLGGLCILRGCMPSKTLIESANRFLTLRRAREFGLRAGEIEARPAEIRERKRRLIADFAGYREKQLADGSFKLVRGRAKFADPKTIEATLIETGETLRITAETSVIATGSVIPEFPLPGLEEAGYLTSDDVLDGETVPDSIIVLGGGAIALELSHYFSALGSKVTVVQRSSEILKEVDADVAAALREAMTAQGVEFFRGTKLERVTAKEGLKTVFFTQDGVERSVSATEILKALGRRPASAGLRLENAGVATQGPRIATDFSQATSTPHIFAAGDVCGPHEIVHLAITQGETAATNAAVFLGKLPESRRRAMDYRLKLFGVFTQPQLAFAGLSEIEAAASKREILVATYPFDDHGKSMVMGETHGFVKLIAAAASGEIIGAAIVGPEAVELIHEIVVAMHFRATPSQLAGIPHYHPTLSEIWTYPAEELAEAFTSAPQIVAPGSGP